MKSKYWKTRKKTTIVNNKFTMHVLHFIFSDQQLNYIAKKCLNAQHVF